MLLKIFKKKDGTIGIKRLIDYAKDTKIKINGESKKKFKPKNVKINTLSLQNTKINNDKIKIKFNNRIETGEKKLGTLGLSQIENKESKIKIKGNSNKVYLSKTGKLNTQNLQNTKITNEKIKLNFNNRFEPKEKKLGKLGLSQLQSTISKIKIKGDTLNNNKNDNKTLGLDHFEDGKDTLLKYSTLSNKLNIITDSSAFRELNPNKQVEIGQIVQKLKRKIILKIYF